MIAGYAVWKYNGHATIPDKNTNRLAVTARNMPADAVVSQVEQDSSDHKLAISEKKTEIRISRKEPKRMPHKVDLPQEYPGEKETILALKEAEPAIVEQEIVREEITVNIKPEIQPLSVEAVASQPKTKENEPSRTIVIAVEAQSNEEDKPKISKFSRVFRQLKNARAGEQVNWEEVGFNPKSLVAKVDDRLRNGEEKLSEKYHHLKEKTKL
ncbi:hypothetical protein FEM33_00600 [Dyadobacter flavalbus]|uniref:Uncharacterized protein n=1 Tax=Dyadobacter flavalbus TaxID=2579942 RepID=A0A5M8R4S4_9BACT|nr:hypothetical protein [Dyadobacter flavalbus]KAA6441803.1 hypothetical protein FEM33_00600 [Dyadobacter flavalbus]